MTLNDSIVGMTVLGLVTIIVVGVVMLGQYVRDYLKYRRSRGMTKRM